MGYREDHATTQDMAKKVLQRKAPTRDIIRLFCNMYTVNDMIEHIVTERDLRELKELIEEYKDE